MKEYLEIKSFGEIETSAFTLIGASTKRNDINKIGAYGSGACYSIASLMNQKIDFKVFSGEDEIKFSTKKQSFRNQDFEVILVNGAETSLTVSMGNKDWDNVFAPIREIYSNALDEDNDATLKKVTELSAEKGFTKFYIELTEEVNHFYKNVHLYFSNSNPKVLWTNEEGTIFQNTDNGNIRVFRKGILAHLDTKNKSLYHYNLQNIEINESRVVKYSWQIQSLVGDLFKLCDDSAIINSLLLSLNGGNSGFLEHTLDWENYKSFSDTWLEVCENKKFAPVEYVDMFDEEELKGVFLLPVKLLKPLKSQFPDLNVLGIGSKTESIYVKSVPSQILLDKVIEAVSMLNNTRYKNRLINPEIEYVKFSKETVKGLAEDNKIYLSTKLDCEDINMIAKIIIEENEHNISGLGDETRNFQNHLFNLYFDELISK